MQERLAGVDCMRLFATVAVILLHTTPVSISELENLNSFSPALLINQFSRFAVPFFFSISGYFWGKSIENNRSIFKAWEKSATRLGLLFVAWTVIYATPYTQAFSFPVQSDTAFNFIKQTYWNLLNLSSHPLIFMLEGSKSHLWFLPSLLICLSISSVFVKRNCAPALIIVSILLYITGVLGKSYSSTPYGIDININTRDGPFFGLIFFVTGYYLSRINPSVILMRYGLALLSVGFFAQAFELYILNKNYGVLKIQDYCFSTYLMSIGAAMIGIYSAPPLHIRKVNLARISDLTLGIYLVHFIFIDILIELSSTFPSFASVKNPYFFPMIVILSSSAFTTILNLTNPFKWLVR